VSWTVLYHDDFVAELEAMAEGVQDELSTCVSVLAAVGPTLGRLHVDTLDGSRHANMKELRFKAENCA
jgi:hypothetical protein